MPAIVLVDQYLADSLYILEKPFKAPDIIERFIVTDKDMAVPKDYKRFALTRQEEDRIPIGIFYRKKKTDFTSRIPVLKPGPLVSRPYDPVALQALLDGDPEM